MKILEQALNKYGYKNQVMVAIEELSEMIKALSKIERYGPSPERREQALDELADVVITQLQMMMILDITEDDLAAQIEKKLKRLADRMESGGS